MPEELKDANKELETSPVPDAESESSTEETQDVEATTQKAAEEVPFHEHPRFKELIEERKELREENRKLQQQMYEVLNKTTSQPAQAAQEKLYQASTPEEKVFWEQVEKIAEAKATKAKKEAEEQYTTQLKSLYNQFGQIAAKEFLKDHPDVKKDSDELKQIVRKASERSLDLDEAYILVMHEKIVQKAAEQEKQKVKVKTQQKIAANVETSSISSEKLSTKKNSRGAITMDEFDEIIKQQGLDIH